MTQIVTAPARPAAPTTVRSRASLDGPPFLTVLAGIGAGLLLRAVHVSVWLVICVTAVVLAVTFGIAVLIGWRDS